MKRIAIKTICTYYHIDASFIEGLHEVGHIQLADGSYIDEEQLADLEKAIRLHQDLEINFEGIDVILRLLANERTLRNEIKSLQNRLGIYE